MTNATLLQKIKLLKIHGSKVVFHDLANLIQPFCHIQTLYFTQNELLYVKSLYMSYECDDLLC